MDRDRFSTRITAQEALKTCEFEQPPRGLTLDEITNITGSPRKEVASDISELVRNNQAHFVLDIDEGISRVIPLSTPVGNEGL